MTNAGQKLIASLVGAALAAAPAYGQGLPKFSGTIESYFYSADHLRGFNHQLSWAELNARFNDKLRFTGSFVLFPGGHSYDEGYLMDEEKNFSIRAGRIRTAFGFNDWTELFYNGFNDLPLIRSVSIVDNLGLSRDDSGVEATTNIGRIQLQASAVDTTLTSEQLLPDRLDHGTLRAQTSFGQVIVGADFLSKFDGKEKVYGLDARWTPPRLLVRSEAFWGDGVKASKGFYADAQYRIPGLIRTQLVARFDYADVTGRDEAVVLNTIGARQVVSPFLSFNLNYGWGSGGGAGAYGQSLGVTGWSGRAMFQVKF